MCPLQQSHTRRCLLLMVLVWFSASPWAGAQQVGVNFNGQFDQVNFNDLARTHTTWVRGFIDFFEFYNNPSKLDNDNRINTYLQLKDNGYKTILNIKFDFKGKDFPAVNSTEMNNQKDFLAQLYDKVWDKTDIMVVGNEPFIESDGNEQGANGPLVKYYRQMCIKTNNYRENRSKKNPIYVGSFDNLYLNSKRKQSVLDLLAFAKNHDYMAGIDLHIHHSDISQVNSVFDWVSPKIRSDQKILVTEYSLMKHWRNQMSKTINAVFASKYNRNSAWKNYQYIDYALKNPVQRAEWVDYFKMHAWYNNRAGYIKNSYDRFKSYRKFHIATYATRQSYPFNRDFTANTDPWVLNPLYVNRTVVKNASGQFQFNYAFIDDFRAIQNGTINSEREQAPQPPAAPVQANGPSEIHIFPNPAADIITILNRPSGAQVYLTDVTGSEIGIYSTERIHISHLKPGLYFLAIPEADQVYKFMRE